MKYLAANVPHIQEFETKTHLDSWSGSQKSLRFILMLIMATKTELLFASTLAILTLQRADVKPPTFGFCSRAKKTFSKSGVCNNTND